LAKFNDAIAVDIDRAILYQSMSFTKRSHQRVYDQHIAFLCP
jgi:hypothetical protein